MAKTKRATAKTKRVAAKSARGAVSARSAKPAKTKTANTKAAKTKTANTKADHAAPARSAAERILAAWPSLGQAHREAFRLLAADAECDALGAKTKSDAVLREALAWCAAIDGALRAHPYAMRRYGPPRFVWFVECVVALEEATRAQRAKGGGAERVILRATARAREVLADLVTALEVVATGRPDALARIADASADPSRDGLVRGLRVLADLADELGRSYEPRVRALAASVTLRAEDAHAARAAAAELEASGAPTAVDAIGDSALVNRLEGRVLAEMRFAKRMLDRLRERAPGVPRLVAGAGTRAALDA